MASKGKKGGNASGNSDEKAWEEVSRNEFVVLQKFVGEKAPSKCGRVISALSGNSVLVVAEAATADVLAERMGEFEANTKLFISAGLTPAKAVETLRNNNLTVAFKEMIEYANAMEKVDKAVGTVLYTLAAKMPATCARHRKYIAELCAAKKIRQTNVEAVGKYMTRVGDKDLDVEGFEGDCGVGVVVTREQIAAAIAAAIEPVRAELVAERYAYDVMGIFKGLRNVESLKWADNREVKEEFDKAILCILGEKTKEDMEAAKKAPKKGKKDKIRISYKGNVGIASRAIPRYDLVDMKDYVEMSYEALRNSAQYGTGMDFEGASRYAAANLGQQIGGLKNPEYYNPYKNYTWETLIDQSTGKIRSDAKAAWNENWLDEISDNSAIRTEHIVSVNGGSERANYVASLGYYMEDGILQNTDFSRYTGRVGADSQAKSWLKIGMNANFAHSESSYQSFEDASTSNVWYTAQFMAPVYPVYLKDMAGNNVRDADGRLQYEYGSEDDNGYANRPSAQGFNSKAELYNNKAYYTRNSLSARSYITFGTVREEARLYGLKLTMNFGTDYTDYQRTLVYDKEHGNAAQQGGRLSKTNTRTLSYTFNQLLTYDRTFGDHSLNLLAGHEYYRYKYNYALGEKTGIVGGIDELGPAVTTTDNNSYSHNYGVESYLARINYGFKSRYYIDASWRTDGSSRFHPSDRWGHFWSVGASWRISEEQFMENTRQWLDNLTLKVSYGVQGNDNLGTYYAWQGLYDYTWPNATDAGAFVDKLENRKVTWEKNGNLNAGIEATMFGGRLGVSVEYYNRKTRDMLLKSPLPISTGFTGFNDNVGSLRNQGLEVSLRGTILDKRDFRWDATLMGSFNRNKVLSLTGGQDVITSDIRVIEVGRPIYTFYLPKTAGVDPATGKQLYYAYWTQTVNDEGTLVNTRCDEYITDNVAMATLSKYYHESREPKLFGSIGSTFTILKNIDVSFLTTYSIGGWVYDGLYNGSMYVQYAGNNWHKNAKRRWQKPGDKTDVPMLEVGGSYATASNSLIDASYFAIKNITVGYTLPKRWLKKIDIESLRIYATLDNIAMFNHMDGMDPQYNFTGSVAYSYTPSRVIAFGIDLNF